MEEILTSSYLVLNMISSSGVFRVGPDTGGISYTAAEVLARSGAGLAALGSIRWVSGFYCHVRLFCRAI